LTVRYADTSVLVSAYFMDEARHDAMRRLLLEGEDQVLTSELTRLEFVSAATAATRAGRIADPSSVLSAFDADCATDGPLVLVRFVERTWSEAYRVLVAHRLRTLDALHLAAAITVRTDMAADESWVFVTADGNQAQAALAEGFELE